MENGNAERRILLQSPTLFLLKLKKLSIVRVKLEVLTAVTEHYCLLRCDSVSSSSSSSSPLPSPPPPLCSRSSASMPSMSSALIDMILYDVFNCNWADTW